MFGLVLLLIGTALDIVDRFFAAQPHVADGLQLVGGGFIALQVLLFAGVLGVGAALVAWADRRL